jgi:hypothetical protein
MADCIQKHNSILDALDSVLSVYVYNRCEEQYRTTNEGPVRIQYKCLVPIYVYNVLSPSSYTHISVRGLYISRIGLPILQQENM